MNQMGDSDSAASPESRVDRRRPTSRRQLFTLAGAAAIGSAGASLAMAEYRPTTKGYADSLAVTGRTFVTDTSSAGIQAAVGDAPDGGLVVLAPGQTYGFDAVEIGDKALTLDLRGATIDSMNAGHYALQQTTARKRLTVLGGVFTGAGHGILWKMPPSDSQSYDVSLSDVSFVLPSSKNGLTLTGAREVTIRDCYFETCTGIYIVATVNSHVMGSQFKNCTAAVDCEGTGTSYDAGLFVNDATMLGCGYGIKIVKWDYFNVADSMIDYCYRPLNVANTVTGTVNNSYLTCPVSIGGVAYPAVDIASSDHIKIANCVIRTHTDLPVQSLGMRISGTPRTQIMHNTIDFWQKFGVQMVGDNAFTRFTGNYIHSVSPTTGPAAIRGASNASESSWCLIGNQFSDALSNVHADYTDIGNYTGEG